MKDIYSPLDIDEEWDNMAPMVDAPVMGGAEGATAVAVKPDEGTADMNAMTPAKEEAISTLPPVAESNTMSTNTMPATPPLVNEGLKEDTASQDAAFEVANADMGMNTDVATNTDDKLNIGEINPAIGAKMAESSVETSAESVAAVKSEEPKGEKMDSTPTPIPVIDMNEASNELNGTKDSVINPGKSFAPEEKPAEDRFSGMEAEENTKAPKEQKPEASKKGPTKQEEPAAAELPVTPADNKVSKFGSNSKNEIKFDMDEKQNPNPEVSNVRLESLMTEWADMKQKTQNRLNDLRAETDKKLADLEEDLKKTQDKIAAAESQRDEIDAKLSELI